MTDPGLTGLLTQIRACGACADLPLGPRPVLQASAGARLLICGQAPGTRAHASGLPFDDASGERLRCWLGLDRDAFYDARRIAIVPIGFCYPGRDPRGGDLPPRPACAPLWRERLLGRLRAVELTLLVGAHAMAWHLGRRRGSVTGTVRAWRDHIGQGLVPLPHPSWRNTGWLRRNPWFAELLDWLRPRVQNLTRGAGA